MATRLEILEKVLTQMRGLVVVDHETNIVFLNEEYAETIGLNPREVLGLPVKQVIPDSKLPVVVESGKAILGDVYYVVGKPTVCNRIPLKQNGVLIGAMSFEVFGEIRQSDKLFDSLQELHTQLDYYKEKLKRFSGSRYSMADIIGSSSAAVKLRKDILKSANTNSTVLVQGETGTGKELVAHALHRESLRAHYPLVKLNCGAIPTELIESELFGYEEGAFTGAKRTGKKGKFELADKGTLFLDEISQLPMVAQVKLLRALQEKEIERIGGVTPITVDVRIVAATNHDLEEMVKRGSFRADLFYRLNVIPIKVPSLRERRSDIPALVERFARKYGDQAGLGSVSVAPDVFTLLSDHEWPGNIRELENSVERAIGMCGGNVLDSSHFEWLLPKSRNGVIETKGKTLEEAKAELEKDMIVDVLRSTGNNVKKTAEQLRIDRSLLYQKMRRLGIQYR
ncbi:MAG: sigma 54-interacting transcriptional regulator [Negativicutes bacterium]|nr:sigma 54-interacting transcriptional regulator [Negativicutes bacterium]